MMDRFTNDEFKEFLIDLRKKMEKYQIESLDHLSLDLSQYKILIFFIVLHFW